MLITMPDFFMGFPSLRDLFLGGPYNNKDYSIVGGMLQSHPLLLFASTAPKAAL